MNLRKTYYVAHIVLRELLGNSKWKKTVIDALKFYESTRQKWVNALCGTENNLFSVSVKTCYCSVSYFSTPVFSLSKKTLKI